MIFMTDRLERVPLSLIHIDRDTRQRRAVDPTSLLDSIRQRGVLNPIIVTSDYVLVAGERRFEASKALGLPDIPVRFTHDLNSIELQIIELEENLKRTDLGWRDEVGAIARLHELYLGVDPLWSQVDSANALAITPGWISLCLRVARSIDDPRVASAASARAAYNILSRIDDRRADDTMSDLLEAAAGVFAVADPELGSEPLTEEEIDYAARLDLAEIPTSGSPTGLSLAPLSGARVDSAVGQRLPQPAPIRPESILQADFTQWAPTYVGRPFNLIHCDFPYGVNVFGGAAGSGSIETSDRGGAETIRETPGLYEDTPEVYFGLIKTLCENLDRLMAHSAHLMFWFGMEHYDATLSLFHSLAPSLVFNPIPLVWLKSDNRGILPDPRRGPRQVYETCLVASREDRFIVRATANGYSAPSDKSHHPSAKPEPVLRYFMGMFVDESTRLLDPTCGGGSALRAAESLGAESVLGLEVDEVHCNNAKSALRSFRALRSVA